MGQAGHPSGNGMFRDSMDEQCIADIAVCVVSGQIIERSKDDLDDAYIPGSALSDRVLAGLEVHPPRSSRRNSNTAWIEILKVCSANPKEGGTSEPSSSRNKPQTRSLQSLQFS